MDLNFSLLKRLNILLDAEEQLLMQEESEYKALPKGSLVVRNRDNHYYYGHLLSSKETGITKDLDLVYRLARKQFLSKALKTRKNNIHSLKTCISSISKNYSATNIKNVSPVVMYSGYSAEEYNWMKNGRSQNPFNPENLIYKTHCGIFVRSKSERIIADRLFHHGIVFRYEPSFVILGKEIYPDFVIRRHDGKLIIWEHNGLMDNAEYAYRAHEKIDRYNKAGFSQHKNLICTKEQDILSDEEIDEIIFRFILC